MYKFQKESKERRRKKKICKRNFYIKLEEGCGWNFLVYAESVSFVYFFMFDMCAFYINIPIKILMYVKFENTTGGKIFFFFKRRKCRRDVHSIFVRSVNQ